VDVFHQKKMFVILPPLVWSACCCRWQSSTGGRHAIPSRCLSCCRRLPSLENTVCSTWLRRLCSTWLSPRYVGFVSTGP